VLAARGGYRLVRLRDDARAPATVTGKVLDVQEWKSRAPYPRHPPRPWLYLLVVDDGRSDTTWWALPAAQLGAYPPGATVRLTARRWSRLVLPGIYRRGQILKSTRTSPFRFNNRGRNSPRNSAEECCAETVPESASSCPGCADAAFLSARCAVVQRFSPAFPERRRPTERRLTSANDRSARTGESPVEHRE